MTRLSKVVFRCESELFVEKAFVRLIAPNPVSRSPTDVHEHFAHPQTIRQWLLTRSLSHSENALYAFFRNRPLAQKGHFSPHASFGPSQTNLWLESRFSDFIESSYLFFFVSLHLFLKDSSISSNCFWIFKHCCLHQM